MGELKRRGKIWWIRWYRGDRRYEESSHSDKKGIARDLLKKREGHVAHGVAVTPKMERLRFDEAAADLLNDYRANDRRSLDEVARRIALHLEPYFGGWRLAQITTADVREYTVQREAETTIVRRAYDLKLKDGSVRRGGPRPSPHDADQAQLAHQAPDTATRFAQPVRPICFQTFRTPYAWSCSRQMR
jgi:hypothetical protein